MIETNNITLSSQYNLFWSNAISSTLQQLGAEYICISPGARNTPLTLAFTQNDAFTCYSHIDERSSGFFALGLAKSTQKPVVLISTSGTAVANYFPAVIEASLSRTPLIILSADRPSQLVGTGANQTINQTKIFGNHVRHYIDIGLPQQDAYLLIKNLTKIYAHASGFGDIPPGPTHINVPFDEPLVSKEQMSVDFPKHDLVVEEYKIIQDVYSLPQFEKPLIVCGRLDNFDCQNSILKFANSIQALIFADPTSQIRFGKKSDLIVTNYDQFLKTKNIHPDIVIRFGSKPTSKTLCALLDQWKKMTVLVDQYNGDNDDCPLVVQSNVKSFCESNILQAKRNTSVFTQRIQQYERIITSVLRSSDDMLTLFDGSVALACFESLSSGDNFFVGNSMPIRDVDTFTVNSEKNIHVFSNRGASGIDGIISTAMGVAINSKQNNLLLVGDLSFLHDIGSLLFSSRYNVNLTIVVINNNGGGIFSFLPLKKDSPEFDEFWTTQHKLDFGHASALYGCQYTLVDSLVGLTKVLSASREVTGIKIIEVKTDIKLNVKTHTEICSRIKLDLEKESINEK